MSLLSSLTWSVKVISSRAPFKESYLFSTKYVFYKMFINPLYFPSGKLSLPSVPLCCNCLVN